MADNKKKKYKKRKTSGGAPKPVEAAAEKQSEELDAPRRQQPAKAPRPQSDKPLFMRIVMLAIAAVMILGMVISAAAGSTSGFF